MYSYFRIGVSVATWIVHLRVAENLLGGIEGLEVGNGGTVLEKSEYFEQSNWLGRERRRENADGLNG